MKDFRNFNFTNFNIEFKKLYPLKELPKKSFLEWFIGFSEGDGCFTIAKRGDLSFVITQNKIDINLLIYIKDKFEFGSLICQSKLAKTYRYSVQDNKNIRLICLLFNGNIVLPTRNAKFITFLAKYNESAVKKNLCIIIPNYKILLPSLNSLWFTGFVDAEGCFNARLQTNNSFTLRFDLTQKWSANKIILDHILDLFRIRYNIVIGKVVTHTSPECWSIRIQGLENCKHLIDYFDNYSLKTKKRESFIKWKSLYNHFILKDHLNLEKKNEIINIIKSINKLD